MTRLLQEKKTQVNFLTIFVIGILGLNSIALIVLLFQGLTIRNVVNRKPPNLIQLIDGKPAPPIDNLERDPEFIRQFVGKIMTATFDWSGKLPPATLDDATNLKPDTGIPIKTQKGLVKKVSTSSWIASFALSEDFRHGFLEQIADMTPPEIFSNSNQVIESELVIQRVYPPEKIAPGKWRVGMVANIVQTRRSDNKKLLTPFNKDFLVQAVDYYEYTSKKDITELQKAIYNVRSSKLEIYEISDLCIISPYENQTNSCSQNLNTGSFTR